MKRQYLTTSDLAGICDVDPQTIKDWANRRGLPHFRTAGRHRRFKPREVVPWLRQNGYDVPPRLASAARVDAAYAEEAEAEESPGVGKVPAPATHASKGSNA